MGARGRVAPVKSGYEVRQAPQCSPPRPAAGESRPGALAQPVRHPAVRPAMGASSPAVFRKN